MNNKDILAKAIERAIDGGFSQPGVKNVTMNNPALYELIFNHDFAKSIWGDERVHIPVAEEGRNWLEFDGKRWEFHLMMMVISEDPIKYLGENI